MTTATPAVTDSSEIRVDLNEGLYAFGLVVIRAKAAFPITVTEGVA
jgi:hypothetical protein